MCKIDTIKELFKDAEVERITCNVPEAAEIKLMISHNTKSLNEYSKIILLVPTIKLNGDCIITKYISKIYGKNSITFEKYCNELYSYKNVYGKTNSQRDLFEPVVSDLIACIDNDIKYQKINDIYVGHINSDLWGIQFSIQP